MKKYKLKDKFIGKKSSQWKGENIKYAAIHSWIRKYKFKPRVCEYCKKNPPYDVANISGKYKRDINDYEWLCRKCHMLSDGRINKNLIFIGEKEIAEKIEKMR